MFVRDAIRTRLNAGSSLPTSTLTDDFVESYVRWREACHDVDGAYARFGASRHRERRLAFAAYRAALDREEHAARMHARLTTCLHRRLEPQ
jgi:hypothetical protein